MRELRRGISFQGGHARAAVLAVLLLVAPCSSLRAQTAADTRQIVERLERLEHRNADLEEEVRQLRAQLSALQGTPVPAAATRGEPPAGSRTTASAATEDVLAIQQARVEEQAQSKVEAAHKLPLRITGMALFNAFYDPLADGGPFSGVASSTRGRAAAGGNLSQSIIGLEFQSPNTVLGAKVHGDVFVDFFGNAPASGTSATDLSDYGQWPMPRLRTGTVSLDWDSRSVTLGVDKPLISPYTPDSFAQVGVPPLSGAGNLWFWEPQARYEQRVKLSENNTLRLQAALFATHEVDNYSPGGYPLPLALSRPAWEGRFQFAHRSGEGAGFDIATGFHFSETHVAGRSVTSDLFSLDGRLQLVRWWSLAGTVFTGQNLAGIGGSGPGFTVYWGRATPVHSAGGWLQLTLDPTERLSFHLFGGAQENRRSDLLGDAISANAAYAGNVYYQLAPNVFAAFEAARARTEWIVSGPRLRSQYDLSLAYLF